MDRCVSLNKLFCLCLFQNALASGEKAVLEAEPAGAAELNLWGAKSAGSWGEAEGCSVGSRSHRSTGANAPAPIFLYHHKAEISMCIFRVVRDYDTLHRALLLGDWGCLFAKKTPTSIPGTEVSQTAAGRVSCFSLLRKWEKNCQAGKFQ